MLEKWQLLKIYIRFSELAWAACCAWVLAGGKILAENALGGKSERGFGRSGVVGGLPGLKTGPKCLQNGPKRGRNHEKHENEAKNWET